MAESSINSFLVEYLVTKMLKGEDLYIGAPDSIRDYMYVDDHVNAYVLAIANKKADGQVFNAGTGKGVTNRELAELIAKRVGYDPKKIKYGIVSTWLSITPYNFRSTLSCAGRFQDQGDVKLVSFTEFERRH